MLDLSLNKYVPFSLATDLRTCFLCKGHWGDWSKDNQFERFSQI